MDLTQDELIRQLKYDAETGAFTWRLNKTRVRAGDVAGSIDTKGRRQIKINGRLYFAHRLAFLYVLGKFPDVEVDHINRDFTDNRWCNLRQATAKQNSANKLFKMRCSRLPTGVHALPSGRFYATIHQDGRLRYLGSCDSIAEAQAAYQSARLAARDNSFLPDVGTAA